MSKCHVSGKQTMTEWSMGRAGGWEVGTEWTWFWSPMVLSSLPYSLEQHQQEEPCWPGLVFGSARASCRQLCSPSSRNASPKAVANVSHGSSSRLAPPQSCVFQTAFLAQRYGHAEPMSGSLIARFRLTCSSACKGPRESDTAGWLHCRLDSATSSLVLNAQHICTCLFCRSGPGHFWGLHPGTRLIDTS